MLAPADQTNTRLSELPQEVSFAWFTFDIRCEDTLNRSKVSALSAPGRAVPMSDPGNVQGGLLNGRSLFIELLFASKCVA
jgi:hypothetical protein